MWKYILGGIVLLVILVIIITIISKHDNFATQKDIMKSRYQYLYYPYYSKFGINGCMEKAFKNFSDCISLKPSTVGTANNKKTNISICTKQLDKELNACKSDVIDRVSFM